MNYPHEKEILEFLKDKNLIVVSNRGPVEFQHKNDDIKIKRGAGGLVSTLLPLMETLNGVWIASAMTLGDAVVAARFPGNKVPIPEGDPKFWVQFVVAEKEYYEEHQGTRREERTGVFPWRFFETYACTVPHLYLRYWRRQAHVRDRRSRSWQSYVFMQLIL